MAQLSTGRNRVEETVSANKTLDEGDSGVVQVVTATCTVTLPATVANAAYTIRNGGDESVTVTVSPNSADKIMGGGFTSVDDKDIVNTLGKFGDEVSLAYGGSTGWIITNMVGTWTYEGA